MKKIALEMALKPFCSDMSDQGFAHRAEEIFRQWEQLWEHGEDVEVLFWTSDGSEILEYDGCIDGNLEYGRYIGSANPSKCWDLAPEDEYAKQHPEIRSLHQKRRIFMENTPKWKLSDLKRLVSVQKKTFAKLYGRNLEVGTTFDPGPEFADSDFKYRRHPEIIGTMRGFIYCASILNEDHERYAGFPDGIPQGTSFGKFFGRQTKCFLRDTGFDYIWFSNGLGFGMETWSAKGTLFDGEKFYPENSRSTCEKMMRFWNDFRKECPDCRIENRGTNLSTGIDLASDGVPLREIYSKVPGVEAPPNSPWAALDSNFGLELAGMLSHIAELPPEGGWPFRYYTHDPWWLNSPWIDRYDRKPHDIYLPLACCRLDENGEPEGPSSIHIFSVDDSWGKTPDLVPRESIPFLTDALKTAPDQASPFVWVYPFNEYHDYTFKGENLDEIFAGDWNIIDAINDGLPLSTVISTGNLLKIKPEKLKDRILIVPALVAPAALRWLTAFAENGGTVIFYGSARTPEFREYFSVQQADAIEGEMTLDGKPVLFNPLFSFGPLDTILAPGAECRVLHEYVQGQTRRPAMVRKGSCYWIRAYNAYDSIHRHPLQLPPEYARTTGYFREAAAESGWKFEYRKMDPASPLPRVMVRVHDNAFYYAYFGTDNTVSQSLSTPDGVPVFRGRDVFMKDGCGYMPVDKVSDLEARYFVTQKESGTIRCRRITGGGIGHTMICMIQGLKDAAVVVRPESAADSVILRDGDPVSSTLYMDNNIPVERSTDAYGVKYTVRHVTGTLTALWGKKQKEYFG